MVLHGGTWPSPSLILLLPSWVDRYPVILSIENHCSVIQQKKMAQYLTDILGDKLDLSSVSSEDATMLPSPQVLRGKILVKVRPCLPFLAPASC